MAFVILFSTMLSIFNKILDLFHLNFVCLYFEIYRFMPIFKFIETFSLFFIKNSFIELTSITSSLINSDDPGDGRDSDINHIIETAVIGIENNNLSENEIQRLLTQVNQLANNPTTAALLQADIQRVSETHGVDLNGYLHPNLQHQGNAGIPAGQEAFNWQRAFVSLAIFALGTAIIYVIVRNGDAIMQFLFDVGQHVIPSAGILHGAEGLLRNPQTQHAMRIAIINLMRAHYVNPA